MKTRTIFHIRAKARLLFLLAAVPAAALLAPVNLAALDQVDARVDTTLMRIGDRVTLTLTVHSDPGESVQFPEIESSLTGFELLTALSPQKYQEEQDTLFERRSYIITTFETGPQTIPRLPVAVMKADGTVDTLFTPEIRIQVENLVTDTTQAALRPLRELIAVAKRWHEIALWGSLALAALVLLIFLWRRYLKKRADRLRGKLPEAPARPAHLVALDELDRIKSLGLIEKGQIKTFHILVSEVVREYIQARFGVEAPEMTTWELMYELEDAGRVGSSVRGLIGEFLEACDLVKFAKYKPRIVQINATFNQAYEIVEKTRPALASAGSDAQEPAAAVAVSAPGDRLEPKEGTQ